ncbi:MAG: ATP-binding protein [Acidobacteriota bacterium]
MKFSTKLFVGMSGVLVLLSFVTINLFFTRAHYVQRDNLRSRLVGIAATGALMVDGEKLSRIRTAADEQKPEYADIKSTLRSIRLSNPDVRYIYTMRRSASPDVYEFVVDEQDDVDLDGNGVLEPQERHARVGEPYEIEDLPEMQRAFDGPIADRELTTDKWGTWLSGYAPIYDAQKKVVGILGIDMSAERVKQEERTMELIALLTFAVATALSVMASVLLARHFTRPIQKLSEALADVAAGNLDRKLDLNRSDEIGRLGEVYNEMAAKLAKARAEVAEYNHSLEQKVAERTAELQRAREAAIEAEKMTAIGTLAGGIAHEFNNLLCAVRGQVELAALSPTRERIRHAAETVGACADRARRITDALLTFASRSPLRVRPTDVRQVIETALELFKRDFSTLNITVVRKFSDVDTIGAEPDRLMQAFANVIANARDAMTQHGGRLTVLVRPVDQNIEVTFRDTGPGIPAEMMGRLFDPFCTTKAPLGPESTPGVGLGLAVAQGIVKNHEGEIVAENNEDGGATFRIQLPVRPWPGKGIRPPHRRPVPLKTRRVMVVEDEPDILSAVRDLLVMKGWQVETSAGGKEALEKVKSDACSLYIIDIAIPGMNGIDLIKSVRGINPAAQFVIISGFAPYELASQLGEEEITAYISKPFRSEDLVETVESLVESPQPA